MQSPSVLESECHAKENLFCQRPFQRGIQIGELKDGVEPQRNGYFHGSCEGM